MNMYGQNACYRYIVKLILSRPVVIYLSCQIKLENTDNIGETGLFIWYLKQKLPC